SLLRTDHAVSLASPVKGIPGEAGGGGERRLLSLPAWSGEYPAKPGEGVSEGYYLSPAWSGEYPAKPGEGGASLQATFTQARPQLMVASVGGDVAAARRLRKSMTGIKLLLWSRLRGHQLGSHKFRRQVPLGPFVVDFACYASRLVVEVDGPAHEASMREDAL